MFIRERRSDEDTPGVHEFVPRYTNSTSGRVMPHLPHRRSPDRPARGGRQVNTNIGEREKMRENRMNETRRRRRYSHHFRREGKAVSPVVATLILILIAVAAAAALYLWLVAWQGGVTKGIGSPGAQYTVTIGGSTSVYPFDTFAVSQFEANNSDVVVSDNQGGTGAGMAAVCAGDVDIGTASSLETPTGLETSSGCQAGANAPVVTTFAFDAVDVVVPVANLHGLQSISYDTLTAIYDGASSTTPTLLNPTYAQASYAGIPFDEVPFTTHAALDWWNVPAGVAGQALGGTCGTETISTVAATPAADAAGAAGTGSALCDNEIVTPVGDGSPCGYTVCAGPYAAIGTVAANDPIVPVERSDASGTTQTFEARVLGAISATGFATSFSGLGFSGCGSNNLLSDCGISLAHAENGNPGVISYVAGNPDAIGYASDGLTRASTSGVSCEGIATAACGIGLAYPGESVGVAPQPALGSGGSISGGVINGGFGPAGKTTTVTIANSYAGARPFEYVTLGAPTGEVERFIEFVLDPANNQALSSESAEVSIYSV